MSQDGLKQAILSGEKLDEDVQWEEARYLMVHSGVSDVFERMKEVWLGPSVAVPVPASPGIRVCVMLISNHRYVFAVLYSGFGVRCSVFYCNAIAYL